MYNKAVAPSILFKIESSIIFSFSLICLAKFFIVALITVIDCDSSSSSSFCPLPLLVLETKAGASAFSFTPDEF